MIKSGFRQLLHSNGNIGNIRHQKALKNYTLFVAKNMKECSFIRFLRRSDNPVLKT